MAKKADAWKEYKEAALVDMMLQVLNFDGDIDNILQYNSIMHKQTINCVVLYYYLLFLFT